MRRGAILFGVFLIAVAAPSQAQRADLKAEGAHLDAALIAGQARAPAMQGTGRLTKVSTIGCSTHLIAGKEDWTIDWKAASVNPASTPKVLKVLMDRNQPDQEFWITFGVPAQGRIAKAASEQLILNCNGR